MHIHDDSITGSATGENAVNQLARLAMEKEKTKRLLMFVTFLFLCTGSCLIIYTPPGKEVAGYIIGGAMWLLSLGAIGACSFKVKAPGIEISRNDQGLRSVLQAEE